MMTPVKSLASAAALLVVYSVLNSTLAAGLCSHDTHIKNNSSITLRFSELKSSSSPPFYKTQWTGSRVIAPGATGIISWTSDVYCKDGFGDPNHFDVKFIRDNGKVHNCTYLTPSQSVKVNTPDLCFPD